MKDTTKKTVLKYCEKFEAAGESVGKKTTVVFERWDRFTNSWKFGALIAVVLIILYALSGCKSEVEKLEENLIAHEWTMINNSGESGIMIFNENYSASCNWGLMSSGYSWSVDEDGQLILVYTDDTFIYEVSEDDAGGYVFTLVDGDYSALYKSYDLLKLTSNDEHGG